MGAKVIPSKIIEEALVELKEQCGVLERWKDCGAAKAHAAAVSQVKALTRILRRGEASADDLLEASDAIAYSGLSRSALDKRVHAAENPKRWRRGDLPIHDVLSCGTGIAESELTSHVPQVSFSIVQNVDIDAEALLEEDLLEQALDTAMAA